MKTIKELKKGQYFTLKGNAKDNGSNVYVKGNYDRSEKKYECCKFNDFCSVRYFPSSKIVNDDIIF